MVYLFLADGFEEVEAITPYDYLKRSGLEVRTIGVFKKTVVGSHGLQVCCDLELDDLNLEIKKEDLILLPGGLKGVRNLSSSKKVIEVLKIAFEKASIAAICAAPTILGELGLLKNLKACCYPGCEQQLKGATISFDPVVVDGNIITSKGAGTAQQFSFAIVEYFFGKEKAKEIKGQVVWEV